MTSQNGNGPRRGASDRTDAVTKAASNGPTLQANERPRRRASFVCHDHTRCDFLFLQLQLKHIVLDGDARVPSAFELAE